MKRVAGRFKRGNTAVGNITAQGVNFGCQAFRIAVGKGVVNLPAVLRKLREQHAKYLIGQRLVASRQA